MDYQKKLIDFFNKENPVSDELKDSQKIAFGYSMVG